MSDNEKTVDQARETAAIPEFKFVGQPLSKQNTETLMGLVMASFNAGAEKPMEQDTVLMDMFLAKVAEKRIQFYPLPFNITNFFFAASVLTFVNTPGMVMGMLWIAKCHADKFGKKLLTVSDWCEIFPRGAPTDKECEEWWDAQKVPWKGSSGESDNLVDYPYLWGCGNRHTHTKETMV